MVSPFRFCRSFGRLSDQADVLEAELAAGFQNVQYLAIVDRTITLDGDLAVRVLACEGGANGGVVFRAVWELTKPGPEPAALARGDFRPVDLRWDGKTEASLAAQLSQAVGGLAGEITAAMAGK